MVLQCARTSLRFVVQQASTDRGVGVSSQCLPWLVEEPERTQSDPFRRGVHISTPLCSCDNPTRLVEGLRLVI